MENNHQLRRLVHLEANPVPDQQILLITQSNVVIVVRLIPRIDAQITDQPASNATELVIIHLNAGPPIAVPILPKIQGNNRFRGRGRTPHGQRFTPRKQVKEAALTTFQDGKLQDICHQTLLDPQLIKLARVIQNGWGEGCGELDADLHAFWIHRFNMHITNGIIMKGTSIVVPWSLQQEYLQCLHMGHLRISKCRARAKTTVFWPNIDRDISQLIARC